jgi:septal ring factor EnvC (AmiA/AmiB activator)
MLASCRHNILCRLRWKQGKLQELETELTKLKSRNSELEQSILNTDAHKKELEDEIKYLKKQADERGSSSGLFSLTSAAFLR